MHTTVLSAYYSEDWNGSVLPVLTINRNQNKETWKVTKGRCARSAPIQLVSVHHLVGKVVSFHFQVTPSARWLNLPRITFCEFILVLPFPTWPNVFLVHLNLHSVKLNQAKHRKNHTNQVHWIGIRKWTSNWESGEITLPKKKKN